MPAASPLRRYSITGLVMTSPGSSAGTPGGYGLIVSAQIRPTASVAGTCSASPKKASLGSAACSSSSSPGAGRWMGATSGTWSMCSTSDRTAFTSRSPVASSSAMVSCAAIRRWSDSPTSTSRPSTRTPGTASSSART
jgi:hypothetical protein